MTNIERLAQMLESESSETVKAFMMLLELATRMQGNDNAEG